MRFDEESVGQVLDEAHVLPKPRPKPMGSEERYKLRQDMFRLRYGRTGGGTTLKYTSYESWLRHEAIWLLHNVVAHPLLAIGPTQAAVEFHELTSQWLSLKEPPRARTGQSVHRVLTTKMPEVEHTGPWVFHNVVAHMLIGLFPTSLTFKLHDWSAELMNIPGWV